ncbi:MAG: hypothetical protein ABIE68_00560 [bacterium]
MSDPFNPKKLSSFEQKRFEVEEKQKINRKPVKRISDPETQKRRNVSISVGAGLLIGGVAGIIYLNQFGGFWPPIATFLFAGFISYSLCYTFILK